MIKEEVIEGIKAMNNFQDVLGLNCKSCRSQYDDKCYRNKDFVFKVSSTTICSKHQRRPNGK